MRHHRFIAFGLLALFVSSLAIGAQGALENVSYEEGYIDWEMDIEQRLYVEGENAENSVLQRARPDATLGFTDVNPGGGPTQIFELTSPPLVNSMKGTINMSTYFSAYIVPIAAAIQPTTCTSSLLTSPPGDDEPPIVGGGHHCIAGSCELSGAFNIYHATFRHFLECHISIIARSSATSILGLAFLAIATLRI